MLTTYHRPVPLSRKSGNLNFLEPSGPVQACNGTALPLLEQMPMFVNSKYIKQSVHDHNVPKNSEFSRGRIPKADRYGTITILNAFLRVDRKGPCISFAHNTGISGRWV